MTLQALNCMLSHVKHSKHDLCLTKLCVPCQALKAVRYVRNYHNDPKFSDKLVWANSADPDQTAPSGAV